ncbi:MAG: two-component system LytT family sensor kinase [Saprospiraceae bacterium]|jgi:two-component system LytT family sensor kinase
MGLLKIITETVTKKEIALFVGFYLLSTLIYYTASWISWGAFKPGHPPYFHLEEFFASAGAQFFISFIVTIPIWITTSILLIQYKLRTRLLSHLLFLPLYITICYFSQVWVTNTFGWAMYFGGYKTVWTLYIFMLFYLVQFAFIHAYSYFQKFRNEQKDKALLREAILKSEIVALKSQLNPHFLHNLFNSINATIPPENERTRELIVQLSDLFRYQNYAAQNEFVTVEEEIEFIKNYLELMQIRLKDRLSFSFEIPKEFYQHKICNLPQVRTGVKLKISI